MTITQFLLARIAEDEPVARAATGEHWHGQACEVRTFPEDEPAASEPYWFRIAEMYHANHFPDAKHIARHDPARVLAECAAKRAIIEHAMDVQESYWQEPEPTTRIAGKVGWLYPFDMLPVLKALAAVYSTHPDYLQEWTL